MRSASEASAAAASAEPPSALAPSASSATAHTSADRFGLACALATVAVALAALAGLDTFPLLDVDEPRFATASRHMLRSSDWIVPWFNGAERFDKPILIYWLQAAAMAVFGPSEFAARLPSTLAVAGSVPMVAVAARRLGLAAPFAVLAGVAVATAAVAQALARGATADALLLFLTAWIARLQIDGFVGRGGGATALGVWIVGALAFLTKGPPALVAPLALAIGIVRAGRRPRPAVALAGFAIATVIVLAWAVPALLRTDGRFWTVGVLHHVVDRSLRPFEGHGGYGPWWYLFYGVAVPAAFLPWSPYLLKLRDAPRLAVFPRPGVARLLGWWFWGTFATFTLVTSKLPHYPLPAFPALAIAMAGALQRAAERAPGTVSATDRAIGRLVGALGLGLGAALPIGFAVLGAGVPPGPLVAGMTFAIGSMTAGRLAMLGSVAWSAWALAATWLIGMALVALTAMPELFWRHGVLGDVQRARAEVFAPATAVATYALSMPSLTFYLDREVPAIGADGGTSAEDRVLERIEREGSLVVTRRRKVGPLFAAVEAVERVDPARGARLRALLEQPKAVLRGFLSNKGGDVELLVLGR